MATIRTIPSVFSELAEFFARSPTRDDILRFRPSKRLQKRASSLLAKRDKGRILGNEEERELDEFVQAELFMGLLKARVRAGSASRP